MPNQFCQASSCEGNVEMGFLFFDDIKEQIFMIPITCIQYQA